MGGQNKFAVVQTTEKQPRGATLVAKGPSGHGSRPLRTNAVVHLSRAVEKIAMWDPPMRLNDTTRHMIGADQFARMKRGAILINTARGGVIDEDALVRALGRGQIAGAGLDVFAQEPLPADHPFLSMDNVVMTPVSAWSTADASARMINQSIENVARFIAGAPVNIVNPGALGA